MASFVLLGARLASGSNVGWFYALDADKSVFEKEAGPPVRVVSVAGGTRLSEYQIGNHKVYAAKMGSGCVNTAVTVSRVTALHSLDYVISTGPAGTLGGNAKPGEWLRIVQVIPWQKCDDRAWLSLENAAGPKDWPDGRWFRMPRAVLASGETFVSSTGQRTEIAREFSADIVEMNAYGLLGALEGMHCKVMILRVVSDRADESAADDFSRFSQSYDGDGGRIVAGIVKSLPIDQTDPAAHEALKQLLIPSGK